MEKRRILITGGAGFIGSNLALALIERGYQVRILDNLSPQIHGEDPLQSELFNQYDIRQNSLKVTLQTGMTGLKPSKGRKL